MTFAAQWEVRTIIRSIPAREVSIPKNFSKASKDETGSDSRFTCVGSLSHTKFQQPEKGRLIEMNGLQFNPAPGLRAEGGPSLPPAAILRPAQMLDGRPINEIGGYERPRSVASLQSVGRSRFSEHIAVEMEDTSSVSLERNISIDYA